MLRAHTAVMALGTGPPNSQFVIEVAFSHLTGGSSAVGVTGIAPIQTEDMPLDNKNDRSAITRSKHCLSSGLFLLSHRLARGKLWKRRSAFVTETFGVFDEFDHNRSRNQHTYFKFHCFRRLK